jgi:hypothetical protein
MNPDRQPIDQQLRSYSAVTIVEEDDIDVSTALDEADRSCPTDFARRE